MNLYVIGPLGGPFKIGWANDPQARLSELQLASYQPLVLHAVLHAGSKEAAQELERQVHKALDQFHLRGEWFACSLEQALAAPSGKRFKAEVDAENVRETAYRQLYALAAEVPEHLRQNLADFVGAKDTSAESIAQARLDAIMPRFKRRD